MGRIGKKDLFILTGDVSKKCSRFITKIKFQIGLFIVGDIKKFDFNDQYSIFENFPEREGQISEFRQGLRLFSKSRGRRRLPMRMLAQDRGSRQRRRLQASPGGGRASHVAAGRLACPDGLCRAAGQRSGPECL